jgi:hypothetical protein
MADGAVAIANAGADPVRRRARGLAEGLGPPPGLLSGGLGLSEVVGLGLPADGLGFPVGVGLGVVPVGLGLGLGPPVGVGLGDGEGQMIGI